MIKLLDILKENKILVPRRSPEERAKNYLIATQKKIQQYIKDGSKGDLYLANTPLSKKYTKEQIKQMIEDKGGYVKENIYI